MTSTGGRPHVNIIRAKVEEGQGEADGGIARVSWSRVAQLVKSAATVDGDLCWTVCIVKLQTGEFQPLELCDNVEPESLTRKKRKLPIFTLPQSLVTVGNESGSSQE